MGKLKSVLEKFQAVKKSVEDEKKKSSESYNDERIFKPQLVKGEEKTKFKLRFLPIEESPTGKPWIQYNYHMFERPGDNKYVKCLDPRTFDPKAANPIADLAKKLFDSENALDQETARKYYRKPRYFTLVYVKEAPENQQNLVGKVLIFEAGVKIFNKLDASIKDLEMCFWDPYKGRDFLLILKQQGKDKWANYDDSSFIGQDGPISNDEKVMDYIGTALDTLKIKEIILGKEKIKSGPELEELLNAGFKVATKHDERPAHELVSGATVSTTAADVDFGEVAPQAEKAKTEKKAPAKEVGDEVADFDIKFDDADFNIK